MSHSLDVQATSSHSCRHRLWLPVALRVLRECLLPLWLEPVAMDAGGRVLALTQVGGDKVCSLLGLDKYRGLVWGQHF